MISQKLLISTAFLLCFCAKLFAQYSWSPSNIGYDTNNYVSNFAVSESGDIFLSTYDNPQNNPPIIYKSLDNGVTWQEIPTTGLDSIKSAHIAISGNVMFAGGTRHDVTNGSNIFCSYDYGLTWHPSNIGYDTSNHISNFAVSESGDIFLSTYDNSQNSPPIIYKSLDNGMTWQEIPTTGLDSIKSAHIAISGNVMFAGGTRHDVTNGSNIFCSYDYGLTWHPSNIGYDTSNYVSNFTVSESGDIFLSAYDNPQNNSPIIYKSSDGGISWIEIFTNGLESIKSAHIVISGNVMFAGGTRHDVTNGSNIYSSQLEIASRTISLTEELLFDEIETGNYQIKPLVVSNTGNSPFVIYDIVQPTAFNTNWQSLTVYPDQSITFQVTFSPSYEGDYSGLIEIVSDANSGVKNIKVNGSSFQSQDTTSSIHNEYKDYNTIIFPNPSTRSNINIKNEKNIIDKVLIVDFLGRQILAKNVNSNEFQINLEGITPNLYYLIVNTQKVKEIHKIKIE